MCDQLEMIKEKRLNVTTALRDIKGLVQKLLKIMLKLNKRSKTKEGLNLCNTCQGNIVNRMRRMKEEVKKMKNY